MLRSLAAMAGALAAVTIAFLLGYIAGHTCPKCRAMRLGKLK